MTKKQFLEKWSRLIATNAKEWCLAIKFKEDLTALLKQARAEGFKKAARLYEPDKREVTREERWMELEKIAGEMASRLAHKLLCDRQPCDCGTTSLIEKYFAWKESRPSRAGEKGKP